MLSLPPRPSSSRFPVCSAPVSPRVRLEIFSLCSASRHSSSLQAGKFPTPVSHAEDLANKITEVRSTIKFQLKKVLCLGVAVGHVQMTDDQVLANVMLSASLPSSRLKLVLIPSRRHQLPRFAAQEELAERQVASHQEHDGQAHPTLLSASRCACHPPLPVRRSDFATRTPPLLVDGRHGLR